MKKKLYYGMGIVIMLLTLMGITGCVSGSPQEIVTTFLNNVIAYDFQAMSETIDRDNQEVVDMVVAMGDESTATDAMTQYVIELMKSSAAQLNYEILEVQEDGDTASVSVLCRYRDTRPLLAATFSEFMIQNINLAGSETLTSDQEMGKLFENILNDKMEEYGDETMEQTIVFSCVKTQGTWKIATLDTTIVNVITSGVFGFANEYNGMIDYEQVEE